MNIRAAFYCLCASSCVQMKNVCVCVAQAGKYNQQKTKSDKFTSTLANAAKAPHTFPEGDLRYTLLCVTA